LAGVVYAGGNFLKAGGVGANYIAQWSEGAWSPLSNQLNAPVLALNYFGPYVYVGGLFSGGNLNGVAIWNGTSFLPLSSGVDGNVSSLAIIPPVPTTGTTGTTSTTSGTTGTSGTIGTTGTTRTSATTGTSGTSGTIGTTGTTGTSANPGTTAAPITTEIQATSSPVVNTTVDFTTSTGSNITNWQASSIPTSTIILVFAIIWPAVCVLLLCFFILLMLMESKHRREKNEIEMGVVKKKKDHQSYGVVRRKR